MRPGRSHRYCRGWGGGGGAPGRGAPGGGAIGRGAIVGGGGPRGSSLLAMHREMNFLRWTP